MTDTIIQLADVPSAIERVLVQGDLSPLTSAERITHYGLVCKELGISPLTRPFDYLRLNGKLTLYANRNCAEQLRKQWKISTEIAVNKKDGDLYIVVATASLPDGRHDTSMGVVSLKGLSGEALANKLMTAETKAKRRATLSLTGLSMLDETEVATIPEAKTGEAAVKDKPQLRKPKPVRPGGDPPKTKIMGAVGQPITGAPTDWLERAAKDHPDPTVKMWAAYLLAGGSA